MATFVNAAENSNYTGNFFGSIATSSPLALTAGNLIIVLVRVSGGTVTVTDTLGNTYTQRATDGGTLRIFSCANCLGGSATITASFSSANYLSIVALQFSGAATASELIGAFTTVPATAGTTVDLAYNTGGQPSAIVVGLADVFAAGPFSFAAFGTSGDPAAYVEPVTDHTSTSFFYRLPSAALAADTVRATCATSGSQKNCLVAVFKPSGITSATRITQAVIEVLVALAAPVPRVTQAVLETLSTSPVVGVMTQYVAEALSATTAVKDYTWQIKDLTDATRWMTGLLVFPVGDAVPPESGGPLTPSQVVIPLPVVTRVVFPSHLDGVPDDCCCH